MIGSLRQDCGYHHDQYQEDEGRTYLGLKRQHYGDHHDMIIMINPLWGWLGYLLWIKEPALNKDVFHLPARLQ